MKGYMYNSEATWGRKFVWELRYLYASLAYTDRMEKWLLARQSTFEKMCERYGLVRCDFVASNKSARARGEASDLEHTSVSTLWYAAFLCDVMRWRQCDGTRRTRCMQVLSSLIEVSLPWASTPAQICLPITIPRTGQWRMVSLTCATDGCVSGMHDLVLAVPGLGKLWSSCRNDVLVEGLPRVVSQVGEVITFCDLLLLLCTLEVVGGKLSAVLGQALPALLAHVAAWVEGWATSYLRTEDAKVDLMPRLPAKAGMKRLDLDTKAYLGGRCKVLRSAGSGAVAVKNSHGPALVGIHRSTSSRFEDHS